MNTRAAAILVLLVGCSGDNPAFNPASSGAASSGAASSAGSGPTSGATLGTGGGTAGGEGGSSGPGTPACAPEGKPVVVDVVAPDGDMAGCTSRSGQGYLHLPDSNGRWALDACDACDPGCDVALSIGFQPSDAAPSEVLVGSDLCLSYDIEMKPTPNGCEVGLVTLTRPQQELPAYMMSHEASANFVSLPIVVELVVHPENACPCGDPGPACCDPLPAGNAHLGLSYMGTNGTQSTEIAVGGEFPIPFVHNSVLYPYQVWNFQAFVPATCTDRPRVSWVAKVDTSG